MKKIIIPIMMVALTGTITGAIALAQTDKTQKTQPTQEKPLTQQPRVNDTKSKTKKPFTRIKNGYKTPLPAQVIKSIEASMREPNTAERNARRLYFEGRLAEAEAECKHSISTSPKVKGRIWNTGAVRVLGKVYLAQGRNQEALDCFLGSRRNAAVSGTDLDVALAYCRLGNLKMAQSWYSDQIVLEYVPEKQRDAFQKSLPGVASLRSLEASILYAQGSDHAMTADYAQAFKHFEAALKLAPQNGLIAYCTGEALYNLNRRAEAMPYYRIAAQNGKGEFAEDARKRVAYYKP